MCVQCSQNGFKMGLWHCDECVSDCTMSQQDIYSKVMCNSVLQGSFTLWLVKSVEGGDEFVVSLNTPSKSPKSFFGTLSQS